MIATAQNGETAARPAAEDVLDARNRDDLVRSHLPLVGHLVREVLARVPAHVNRDDLVSAGMYALALAANSFDPSRGTTFSSLASIRIRGALIDELRAKDWASRAVRGKARRAEATRSELAAILGRTPRRAEVAQSLGISVPELNSLDADVHRASVVSLQALTADSGDDLLPSDIDDPERVLLKREEIGCLHDAVEELPARLRTVVRRYFFEQHRMADIADELGVTESRVSQLRSEALVMLRSGMHAASDPTPAKRAAPAHRRDSARENYLFAVATRSTLGQRLASTTVLGEPIRLPA